MKWATVLRTLRRLKEEGIDFLLGANAFLLSPWIPSSNDNGWRIRIAHDSLSIDVSEFNKIIRDLNLNTRLKKIGHTNYFEIYQPGYCDPIHANKFEENSELVPITYKEVLSHRLR